MRATLLASFAVALLGCGCGDDGLAIFVELQTDLAPGEEFAAVEVRIYPGTTDTVIPRVESSAAFRDRDSASPTRVAEVDGLAPGPHLVDVILQDDVARMVVSRRVRIELTATRAVRVLITRDCVGVSCDVEETCVGGECASNECSAERPDRCAVSECAEAEDCGTPDNCAVAMCVERRCLFPANGDPCAPTEWCDPTRGCVERTPPRDAGGMDGGRADGGRADAGAPMDAGGDAGADGGVVVVDAGTLSMGLIGHWRLDEASGMSAADSSSIGADGTLRNFPATPWLPTGGQVDGALLFDGLNDFVSIEGSSATGHPYDFTSGPFTIVLWTNPSAINGTLISKRDDTGDQFQLLLGATTRLVMRAGDEWGSGTTVVPFGAWTHVGVVVDAAGRPELFVDGEREAWVDERGTRPFTFPHIGTSVALGARFTTYPTPSFLYDGSLDDVRIYDRALSDAEMRALYESGAP